MSGGYLWFIARMTEILAWPVTVLLSVWWLRGHLFRLLQNLRSLKYKDMEIIFGEALDRAEMELGHEHPHQKVAQDVRTQNPVTEKAATKDFQQEVDDVRRENQEQRLRRWPATSFLQHGGFEKLLQISASAAIIEAWSYIEGALVELAEKHSYEGQSNVLQMIEYLQRKELLSSGLANALHELRKLRNVAAHKPQDLQISRADAYRYKVITFDAYRVLASLADSR